MTRKTTTRRTRKTTRTPARATAVTPRAVLLAGLGAVSLGRKQARKSIASLATGADDLRHRADDLAREAGSRVARLRKQARTTLAPVKKQVEQLAKQAQAGVDKTLVKLGVKPAPTRRRAPAKAARRGRPVRRRA